MLSNLTSRFQLKSTHIADVDIKSWVSPRSRQDQSQKGTVLTPQTWSKPKRLWAAKYIPQCLWTPPQGEGITNWAEVQPEQNAVPEKQICFPT